MGNILRAFGPDDENKIEQEPEKHQNKNNDSFNISITSDIYNKKEYITREIEPDNSIYIKDDNTMDPENSIYIQNRKRSDNDFNKYKKYKEKYLMMKNELN